MGESVQDNMSWLPKRTQDRILVAASDVERALGDALICLALVGAAVHPDRTDRAQTPELLVIATSIDNDALHRLAKEAKDSMRSGIRLRVMSEEELKGSTDVFALELAEYRARHVLISGEDLLADLELDEGDLRHSLEQGLRSLARQMRNRVLAAAVHGPASRVDPNHATRQGLNRFTVLARHSMRLLGHEPPASDVKLIRFVSDLMRVDGAKLLQDMVSLRSGQQLSDPLLAVAHLLVVLNPLIGAVDAHNKT